MLSDGCLSPGRTLCMGSPHLALLPSGCITVDSIVGQEKKSPGTVAASRGLNIPEPNPRRGSGMDCTCQMPQPSWEQNSTDPAESQALKLSKSRKLSTFAASQSLSTFPPRRTVCADPSTLPPSCPRRRGGGAGTAAPGDSKEGAAMWRPPQRTPGGEDTRKSSRQAPRAQLYKI